MRNDISYIHSNKLAVPNKLYYGKDGVYIGLSNGRLKKLDKQVETVKSSSTSEILSKILYYDSSENIILIEEYNNNSLQRSKQIFYDSAGNVIKISVSGNESYIKEFEYNSSENLTNINITK